MTAPPPASGRRLAAFGLRVLALGLAAYLGVVGFVWAVQEVLLFPGAYGHEGPEAVAALRSYAGRVGFTVHDLTLDDGTRTWAWHLDGGHDRVVLFFHGNGGDLGALGGLAPALAEAGWDLVGVEYRGYPGAEGVPTQATLVPDALEAWAFVTGPLGYAPERVVLHGRSIGGGPVGQLAAAVRPGGVVLDATFDSAAAVARGRYPFLPVGWLLRSPFDTVSVADRIVAPVLQVHSRDDRVIPYARAERLRDALPDVTFVAVDGRGHAEPLVLRDPVVAAAWRAFLERVVPPAEPGP